jgi:hypothetical protein
MLHVQAITRQVCSPTLGIYRKAKHIGQAEEEFRRYMSPVI